jgi:dCTP diphosphatase
MAVCGLWHEAMSWPTEPCRIKMRLYMSHVTSQSLLNPRIPYPTFSHRASMVNKEVQDKLAAFVAERDWAQFHTPENLAKSVAIEAGELLECFQWSAEPDPKRVQEELADVLTYCLLLSKRIGVDPDQIVLDKLEITKKKYPVEKARGSSKKYDQLDDRPA